MQGSVRYGGTWDMAGYRTAEVEMDRTSDKELPAEVAAGMRTGSSAPSYRVAEPSLIRVLVVFVGVTVALACLLVLSRWLALVPGNVAAGLASIGAGAVATLLAASLIEWAVHRWIMHRPSRLPVLRLAYEHHHRAHHWINFPPDQYIQAGPVQYVPLWAGRLDRVATSPLAWAATVAAHVAFYAVFAVILVLAPAWLWSGNALFAGSVTATSVVVLFLFIHAHDAMHYPGLSPIERLRWFKWLDHHHYIHHVDTGANTNFLLPLGDLLLGTLRRELAADELRRWPSYEQARARLVTPSFTPDGTRLREAAGPA